MTATEKMVGDSQVPKPEGRTQHREEEGGREGGQDIYCVFRGLPWWLSDK